MTPLPTDPDDARFARWQGWARTIAAELWLLLSHQHLWTMTRDALNEHQPQADQIWLRHYSRLYADAQLMTLRRLTDNKRGVLSITRLLRDLVKHPQVITRDRFADLLPILPGGEPLAPTLEEEQRRHDPRHVFDRDYGDDTGRVRRQLIKDDLATLTNVMTDVKRRADEAIAHLSSNYDRDEAKALTYADLRNVIAEVVDVGGRWVYLLQGQQTWWPVFMNDWQEPLREPVFPPGSPASYLPLK